MNMTCPRPRSSLIHELYPNGLWSLLSRHPDPAPDSSDDLAPAWLMDCLRYHADAHNDYGAHYHVMQMSRLVEAMPRPTTLLIDEATEQSRTPVSEVADGGGDCAG